jgi:hypothetical protein
LNDEKTEAIFMMNDVQVHLEKSFITANVNFSVHCSRVLSPEFKFPAQIFAFKNAGFENHG